MSKEKYFKKAIYGGVITFNIKENVLNFGYITTTISANINTIDVSEREKECRILLDKGFSFWQGSLSSDSATLIKKYKTKLDIVGD